MIQRAKSALRALLPKNAFARGVSVLVGGTAETGHHGAGGAVADPALQPGRLWPGRGLCQPSGADQRGLQPALRTGDPAAGRRRRGRQRRRAEPAPIGADHGISGVLVALLATPIAGALGVPALAGYLWLLPVGVLLGGGYSVFNYWSMRTKRFSTIASTRIRQSLATLAIQLAAFKLGGLALLLGQVAGQGVGATSLARPAVAMPAFRQVSWGGVWQAAVRYWRFPVFLTWDGLLNTTGTQLPPLLFASFFSPAAAGLYSLANRVLALPISLLGSAIGQVFFRNAPKAYRAGQHGQLVARLKLSSYI